MPLHSSAGLATLVAHLSEAILVTDTHQRVTQYLGQAERLYGWPADHVIGRALSDLPRTYPEGDGDLFMARMAAAEEARVVMRCQRQDGTCVDLDVVVTPLRDQSGAFIGWLSVARDVTQRLELQQQLRAAHGQLADMAFGADDGYWDWHLPSGQVSRDRRWAEMLGYRHDELPPDAAVWIDLLHPDDATTAMPALEAHLQGRTPRYESEHRLRHRNGHWVWVHDRGKIVQRDATGAPVRLAGAHTDTTARKVMEHTLRERESELRAALASNEALVADLRAALDRVKTLSALLPLCMHCRRVRDDAGYWAQIEEYLALHTETSFSHGICPECLKAHYPEYPQPGAGP
ncbi:hypothetical protein TBR22_A14980 [Luteitalea sp. TBR-22]|uniref:PAS domain-containing protein n=1 Tax=Luteitalea sp. TBR-22 TaxID=2802971 RepID=UPI001EF616C2|nr:PAS domain-containing protein [Luteitalea sp. TBR-22]BCS32288.2 hypothetical protein TBR22_A14980 [Luteitalea sp. TBR-22]